MDCLTLLLAWLSEETMSVNISLPADRANVETRRAGTKQILSSTALTCCRVVLNETSSFPSLFVSLGSVGSFVHSRGQTEWQDETNQY